jgi:hypothetical protein
MKRYVVSLVLDISGLVKGDTADEVRKAVRNMLQEPSALDCFVHVDDFCINVEEVPDTWDQLSDDEICDDHYGCDRWYSRVKKDGGRFMFVNEDDE